MAFFRQTQKLPFCHIWYKNSDIPVVSPVTSLQEVARGHGVTQYGGYLKPHLLGCYPPDSAKDLVPVSVSLVEKECPRSKPSNNLRIHFDRHESGRKQGFAVCSKWISNLGDFSMRLIEWIELLRAHGVAKIMLTVIAVHPNVMKVLT